MDNVDVAVVGGGAAGLAAALTAARCGARTLLLEKHSILGGNMTLSLVHTICGLYELGTDSPHFVNPGFPEWFARALIACNLATEPESVGRVYVLPTFPHAMAPWFERLCRSTDKLVYRTDSAFTEARFDPQGVEVGWRDPDGPDPRQTRCSVLIDTSGDAVTAESEPNTTMADPDRLQIPSLIFRIDGVDESVTRGYSSARITRAVARAVQQGELPEGCESFLIRPAREDNTAYVTLNVPRPEDGTFNPLDPDHVQSLESTARDRARAVVDFLRNNREGFDSCTIVEWPERLGIRETRRMKTQYTLTREDIMQGREFDDRVARSSWPIELWHDHRRAEFEYPDSSADIPLRSLIASRTPRVGVAGRCMGGTHAALGALRVIGTALATGQAAGAAAALAADRSSSLDAIPAADVRDRLNQPAWNSDDVPDSPDT